MNFKQIPSRAASEAGFFDPLRHRANTQMRNVSIAAGTTVYVNLVNFDGQTALASMVPAYAKGIVKSVRLLGVDQTNATTMNDAQALAASVRYLKNGTEPFPAQHNAIGYIQQYPMREQLPVNIVFDKGDVVALELVGIAVVTIQYFIQVESWFF